MKKILVVFIVLGLVFALTVCGNTEEIVNNESNVETLSDIDEVIDDCNALIEETYEEYGNSMWFDYDGETYQVVFGQFNNDDEAPVVVYDEDGNDVFTGFYSYYTGYRMVG